jgi:hypothetical protein
MKKPLDKIEWQAPEYEFHQKSPDWFWALGSITIALFFSAIFLHSFLFGILTLLAGFSLALYGARRPNIVSFGLGPRGIQVNKRIYNYEDLKSFWLNYNPPHKKELLIESKKTFMPHMVIMLGDADPEKIRNYLLQFLKEEKIEESLMTTIARLLKI